MTTPDVEGIAPDADPILRVCSCLFTPCQCARIGTLTPGERVAEQEVLVSDYWRRRPGRLAEAMLAAARLVTQTARAERERLETLVASTGIAHGASRGLDAQTVDERQQPRAIIGSKPRGRGWGRACEECGINDGQALYLERATLHKQCRPLWRARLRAAAAFLRVKHP